MGRVIVPLARLAHAGWVMAREGVFALVPTVDLPASARLGLALARSIERRSRSDTDAAGRLTAAFNRLGPSYVKLGQFLATRADVVGREAAADLARLQDQVPAAPEEAARAAVAEALGRPVDEMFVSFGPAVAAASIAQVHKAVVRDADGSEHPVAVKVLKPGVARRFARDLESFYLAARLIERFSPSARRLRPIAVVDTLARSVVLEMDLRLEAAALSEMAENTQDDPGFRLPVVDWRHTAKSVLTMEWIDGIKLSEVERLREAGHDLVALSETIIQSFLRHAMRDGFFHADMHQGNLFVVADGTLVAVDLGIMGRLDAAERRFLAEILYGFIRRDYRRVAEVHFEAGYVPAGQDVEVFAQALRAIGEPIRGQTAADISMARLLTQLLEVTEMFAMRTQPRLILLQKTMVVVEGVARTLDPQLDIWRTAEPVVSSWIAGNLGPAGRLASAAGGLGSLLRLAGELPALATRAEAMSAGFARMAEKGLDLSDESVRRVAAARRDWTVRLPLWVGAGALVAIAISLL
ncbi:2-polyprenylphenol 6-hydroxylase [Pseudoxanthobacter sp. M-2]|uniref:2-polyprenylphenol 6-hydroxylase n=1 Tax=Pseudoxanthobacter sp. M-2 TaxID=3078754 RepID=UPI0038FCADF7